MRRLIAVALAVSLLALPAPPVCAATADALLSAIRAARGDSIPTASVLTKEAQSRAVEIAAEFSHAGWGGEYAEILAWNSYPEDVTEQVAVEQWLDSPGHRRILLGDYTHVGVGVQDVEPQHFYVALFGRFSRPTPTTRGLPPAPKVLPATDTEGCG